MKSGDARAPRHAATRAVGAEERREGGAHRAVRRARPLAVLRRERKRRIEAADAYRAAGAEDRAAAEEAEAVVIDEFLPRQPRRGRDRGDRRAGDRRDRRDLAARRRHGDAGCDGEDGRARRRPSGAGSGTGTAAGGLRFFGWRRSRRYPSGRWLSSRSRSRTSSHRSSAPIVTGCSRRSRSGSDARCTCAATRSPSRGRTTPLGRARIVIEELGGLVEQGLAIGPQTVDALGGVLDSGGSGADVLHDVVWRHRGKKIAPKTLTQKRYVDAIRRATVTFGIGPAGTGKTYLAMALAVAALRRPRGLAHHPHAPRGRGRRAARLPARRHAGEGRPVPAAAVRRALRHARRRPAADLDGARA